MPASAVNGAPFTLYSPPLTETGAAPLKFATTTEFDVTCETHDRTGVEMEALTGASAAVLCLYDMTKGLDAGGAVRFVGLLSKSGGKSGDWERRQLP